MPFISDTTWWITAGTAMAVAALPAMLKSIRVCPMLLIVVLWLVLVIVMALKAGILAALTGGVISLLWGVLLMLASLLFSGLRQMAKKRYG